MKCRSSLVVTFFSSIFVISHMDSKFFFFFFFFFFFLQTWQTISQVSNLSTLGNSSLIPWKNIVAVFLVAPIGMLFAFFAITCLQRAQSKGWCLSTTTTGIDSNNKTTTTVIENKTKSTKNNSIAAGKESSGGGSSSSGSSSGIVPLPSGKK